MATILGWRILYGWSFSTVRYCFWAHLCLIALSPWLLLLRLSIKKRWQIEKRRQWRTRLVDTNASWLLAFRYTGWRKIRDVGHPDSKRIQIFHTEWSVAAHSINQSIKTNLYSALRRRRIRGACWTRLGSVWWDLCLWLYYRFTADSWVKELCEKRSEFDEASGHSIVWHDTFWLRVFLCQVSCDTL